MEKLILISLVSFFWINQCFCATLPEPPAPPAEQYSAPLTLQLGKKQFLIVSNEKRNWFGALHYCRRHGMDLATVESNLEHYSLLGLIKDKGVYREHWIGANDLEYNDLNKFYWQSSGEKVAYTNWAHGQPDNDKNQENCVHMIWKASKDEWKDGWNDWQCKNTLSFICSKTL